MLEVHFGIGLLLLPPDTAQWALPGVALVGAFLASLMPEWRAYRLSLAHGLSPRSRGPAIAALAAAAQD